jgi:hypothetical protein
LHNRISTDNIGSGLYRKEKWLFSAFNRRII